MRYLLFLGFLTLLGCHQKKRPTPHNTAVVPIKEVVFEGLNRPWSMAFLSEDEALVTEKNGNLLKIDLRSKTKKIIKGFPTDLTDSIGAVHIGDNSGIYEVLLHPDFSRQSKNLLFVCGKEEGGWQNHKVCHGAIGK